MRTPSFLGSRVKSEDLYSFHLFGLLFTSGKQCRNSKEIKVSLKPTVVTQLRDMKALGRWGSSYGDVLQHIFHDLARMEGTFRSVVLDLRNKINHPDLLDITIKMKATELFRRKTAWVRICTFGVTQAEVDNMRKFFPGIIPGHTKISEAKKELLHMIERTIPIIDFPDGHGHDLDTLLEFAAQQELEKHKDRLPKALIVIFSLDAKLLYRDHFTQVTFR